MSDTAIEWTDTTWNPTTGCDRVSPGCDNCYALTMAKRLKGMGSEKYQTDGDPRTSGPGFGIAMHPDTLTMPFSWRKPRKVFVNSMSDLFHQGVTAEFIAGVWAVMAATPQHTYQILTKRHGRMRSLLNSQWFADQVGFAWHETLEGKSKALPWSALPLPNVWLGVSVEDQQRADLRIPALINTRAAKRFLSCEPLLGPVDLSSWMLCADGTNRIPLDWINWVIVGGESGPGARPMHPDWARSLRDQCANADVDTAFHFKQWGEWGPAPWSVRVPEPEGGWHGVDADWLAAEKKKAEALGATHHIQPGGHLYEPPHKTWSLERDPDNGHYPGAVRRWGKKRAGRELDGRTWDEFPQQIGAES